MTLQDVIEQYPDEQLLKADGFDEAVIGVTYYKGQLLLVYDTGKCIELLAKDMTMEEATEYFDYNVQGSYMGDSTPIFVDI